MTGALARWCAGALTRELDAGGDRERAPDRPRDATTAVLVAQVRPIVLDLLQATGLDRAAAQRAWRREL